MDDNDRSWLHKKMKEVCKKCFKEEFGAVFKHLATQSQPSEDDMRSLMFGDYINLGEVIFINYSIHRVLIESYFMFLY